MSSSRNFAVANGSGGAQADMPATIFIPEKYLTHNEFLIELPGFGWGIEIEAVKLGPSIRSGLVVRRITDSQ